MRLTNPQRELLRKLHDEDGHGVVRHMTWNDRQSAYALKAKGLVETDGAIASSVTEGSTSFNGTTFVLTEAGRRALQDGGKADD